MAMLAKLAEYSLHICWIRCLAKCLCMVSVYYGWLAMLAGYVLYAGWLAMLAEWLCCLCWLAMVACRSEYAA
jgi:uncharacterized membrane protein